MGKIKIGVLGGYRGTSMINYCKTGKDAEIVAICDSNPEVIKKQSEKCQGLNITFYDNFDEFIKHDMDAVVLANYATEHAPFAIRALAEGKHVYSEVLPCQTMKEAVELIEAVEKSDRVYAYGENYCYMPAPYEMRRLYREGKIGEVEYAECEYFHNCEDIWHSITYGDPNHWRNNMYSTFYCTHSLGPIIHTTALRPVSVVGFEGGSNARTLGVGRKGRDFGIIMVTLENGAIVKSGNMGTYKNSVWYRIDGTKGRMESGREDAENGGERRIYVNADEYPGAYHTSKLESYMADEKLGEESQIFGHSGSDFYCMDNFIKKIQGKADADVIDVFEALDMFLPGMFAYRSILGGNIPLSVPNLRNKEERERWRFDTTCTDPKVAGDMFIPARPEGNPEIAPEIYERQKKLYLDDLNSTTGYANAAFTQSENKK